ncbi:hypothetical protein BD309DRAFT_975422 [Dichomitus squalens]|nr:hypothetical protein BD309DRAFT_975422 [Dichomitus squalens]
MVHDVGKPPSTSNSSQQLVRAMKMAVETHKERYELEILHRAISPGNIMIRMDVDREEIRFTEIEKDGGLTEGFLTDLELAESPSTLSVTEGRAAANNAAIGAFSVMASSLLETIAQATSKGESVAESVLHLPEHDVESFAWVFLFVVYKAALDTAKDGAKDLKEGLQKEFRGLFPGISPTNILEGRGKLRLRGATDCILQYLKDNVKDTLFRQLLEYIRDDILIPQLPQPKPAETPFRQALRKKNSREANEPPKPVPLATHKILLDAFNLYLTPDDVSKSDDTTESDASD